MTFIASVIFTAWKFLTQKNTAFVNFDWQYVAYPGGILAVVVIIWSLFGGSGAQLSSDVANRVASEVVEAVADSSAGRRADLTALRKENAELQHVEVYVDRSLSMMPYLASRENSDFYGLLNRLGNFVGSETRFYGFGYESAQDEKQTVSEMSPVRLKEASSYTYKNNDYGSLLGRLSKGEATNLVMTDGVQSDPKTKAQLGRVLSAIDQWVRSGGTFATLIHRTPYHGQYYSDLPGEEPDYSCSDRPLSTFALGQSPSAVDDLLERFGPELQPDHVVRLGENPLPIRPVQRTVAEEGRRGRRVFRSTEEYVLKGFEQVFKAPIAPASTDSDGFAPLQFRATIDLTAFPWKALGETEVKSLLESLEPEVEAFTLSRGAIERINQPDRQQRASILPQQANENRQSNQEKTLVKPTSIQLREMPDPVVNMEGDSARVQFTIPARRPEAGPRSTKFALLVRLGVGPRGARMLIPDEYSTTNDLNPANCDKVLNLQQLVGTIMHRNYAPGQALLLSEWR